MMHLSGVVASISLVFSLVPACQPLAGCPGSPDALGEGTFNGIGEETLVFTGYVVRYVDAPVLDARGYDLGIRRWLKGRPPDAGVFLRVPRSVPGVGAGDPVMIIVEPGPRDPIVVPGLCTPLIPITDAEVEGDG